MNTRKVITVGNLFDGLEKFGLKDLQSFSLFEEKRPDNERGPAKKEFTLSDYIFPKSYECPACGENFKENTWRTKKGRPSSIDYDFLPIYSEPIQPVFYDVPICPRCGYAAVSRSFTNLSERQAQFIRDVITPKYTPVAYPDQLTADMAIERYKLALMCCVVKKGKDGEKGYICMKLAWLYRLKEDSENELRFITGAHAGFSSALSNDSFPVCGMDESTVIYLTAAYAKVLKKYDEALRLISRLILSKTVNSRIRERSIDLKNEIRGLQGR